MSTFTGLNTVSSGLSTHQLALNTVGHNITNADTEGYSRQQVHVSTRISQTIYTSTGAAQVGNGADVMSILRARDTYSDRQYWKENCTMGYYQTRATAYDKIESVFNDSKDNGIQDALNSFISSLENLDSAASTDSVRTTVRDSAKTLVNMINNSADELRSLINDDVADMQLYIDKVNGITEEIAELNKQIITIEGTGSTANDLRDSRDLLVDELSGYININVSERDNGAYTITSNGNTLVFNHTSTNIAYEKTSDGNYGTDKLTLKLEGMDVIFSPTDGKIKAYQDSIAECQNYLGKTSQLAAYVMTEFNEIHNSGFGLDDCATGYVKNSDGTYNYDKLNYANNFFGEDGYKYTYNADGTMTKTAYDANGDVVTNDDGTPKAEILTIDKIFSELAVNSKFDVNGGTNSIAAKQKPQTTENGTTTGEDNAAGTNAALLATALNSSKTNTDGTQNLFGGVSMTEFYISSITELGSSAQAIDQFAANQEGVVETVTTWRANTSGVNWDEELSNMIMYQQGYKACSKCITAIEEMLDALISCV